jgi:transcriptional regulator with XRE-family HTH domain
MSTNDEFRALLRSHRKRAGQTQQQLADLSALSVRAVRDLELGCVTQPRRDTVKLLADGLRLTGRTRAEFEAAAGHAATIRDLKEIFDAAPAPPPAALDSIIGRQAEVSVLEELLTTGERLVTITGLAGVGKTRLALEVAGRLHTASGCPVLWSSVADPVHPRDGARELDQLAAVIRAGLDALLSSPGDAPVEELIHLIGQRRSLLVLDGYHSADLRSERIVSLLEACPGLRALITSTLPLDVSGERTLPLAPLAVPERETWDVRDRVASAPSTQLLLRHVRHVAPEFELTESNAPAVAELCDLLDGLPTALAAAASWFLVYEPEALLGHVRIDPCSHVVRAGDTDARSSLRESLDGIIAALRPSETRLLDTLAGREHTWTVAEAARYAGIDEAACAGAVRRLMELGVLRSLGEERARFRVLNLVRLLHDSSQTARQRLSAMRHVAPRQFQGTV